MEPLISVIVPVYNVEQYLGKCVESLLRQEYQNLEILLVDDGSPDNCPILCDEYAAQDSRIHVIHKKNGGLADARNAGLDQVNGEYIAFVDSDDWIAPETYRKMMDMFYREPGIDIVCCAAARVVQEREAECCFSYYANGTICSGREITRRILLDEIGSQVVKGLYKRMCWEGIRFPLGRLYEDIPTTFRAFRKATWVGFISEPFYKYRCNDAGISNTPKAIKPYHIYLGFKSHYECAVEDFPEIADRCCSSTAHYAISTYFHYCSENSKELEPAVEDVLQFINTHKSVILRSNDIPKSRKFALWMYFMFNPAFRYGCRLFRVLGLQKKLGFDMK